MFRTTGTLRQLQIFEVAASCCSYTRTAEQLDLSRPAVSMQMQQLEQELGLSLFERQGRSLALTDAGRELLRHARAILAQVRTAEDALSTLHGSTRGQLHLGVVSTAHYFAPLLMTAFRRRHPQVRLKLSVHRREQVLALLGEHKLDLAIAGYPPSDAEVEAVSFARHPHCIVAPPDHPLAGQRAIPWEALRDEPFIFREAGSATRQFLEHLLQSHALQVHVSIELDGNETVKQAVMAGMGISFLSAHAFQLELRTGALTVLDVVDMPKSIDWCVLHRRDTLPAGVTALFRDYVLSEGAALTRCETAAPPR
ncbi:DNA-binding transcriptional LysR family regulator [Sphaerotilus hippei]|uniref:DNA-binding transcriptional LysR family regulator n=1 Tax=Sphaerotilus hippei TaxID=744406 RepID=A0A318HAW8_9BURK|nr:LysR substrate-binding domain-containing protein [Sphaerotilus hippei]PXW99412.1 DNA-binding transcriptional LysR family regulator [Sphaerotilus hippei]